MLVISNDLVMIDEATAACSVLTEYLFEYISCGTFIELVAKYDGDLVDTYYYVTCYYRKANPKVAVLALCDVEAEGDIKFLNIASDGSDFLFKICRRALLDIFQTRPGMPVAKISVQKKSWQSLPPRLDVVQLLSRRGCVADVAASYEIYNISNKPKEKDSDSAKKTRMAAGFAAMFPGAKKPEQPSRGSVTSVPPRGTVRSMPDVHPINDLRSGAGECAQVQVVEVDAEENESLGGDDGDEMPDAEENLFGAESFNEAAPES